MIKRIIIMLLLVAVCIGGLLGFKYMNGVMTKQFLSTMPIPAQTVSTTKAVMQEWQPKIEAVGTFRAINGADLAAEVSGIVSAIHFESGREVEKDAVLVELRSEDDVAKLHAYEATAKLADITLQRDLVQLKTQAVSKATIDNDQAALDNAKAQVAAQQALIDKKTIRAPFAGMIGLRQIDLGQYLNPGAPIATLQQLDPIYVDFNLPERQLAQIAIGQKVSATVDAHPQEPMTGEILAINSKIDEASRNVQVRATFANPNHVVMPGMFARVSIAAGAANHFITLPQTAITYNPYGNTVYVVVPDDKGKPMAKQTFITLGDTRGDQVAVLTGVKEGDEVVTAGQIKLRNGVPVIVNNDVQPTNDAAPNMQDK